MVTHSLFFRMNIDIFKKIVFLKKTVIGFLAFLMFFNATFVGVAVEFEEERAEEMREIQEVFQKKQDQVEFVSADKSEEVPVKEEKKNNLLSQIKLKENLLSNTAFAADGKVSKAKPQNTQEEVFDLVVILIESKLDKLNTPFPGLSKNFDGLKADTIGDRIIRYAEDIVENNSMTDVQFLFFDRETDSVADTAEALRTIYSEGVSVSGHKSVLKGVVLVGDIPLPVVNNNGNRYVSVFPFTDFTDPVYVFDKEKNSFEKRTGVDFPAPEIWHGIIRQPDNTTKGINDLAEFFDKNHLYYTGHPQFSKFEKKFFYGDLVHEEEKVSDTLYKRYLKYLESWEDLAYNRYNKYWARDLNKETNAEIGGGLQIDESLGDFADALSGDPFKAVPDIYTKQIIDKMLPAYHEILTSFFAKINDFAEFTGRYKPQDMDSMPQLIGMKDEVTKYYLRKASDALETKINEVVEKIQEPLPILESVELSGRIADLPEVKPFKKINYKFHYDAGGKMFINGVSADVIESPKLCLPYLGSTDKKYFTEIENELVFDPKSVGGEYSVLTRSLLSDDIGTMQIARTFGINGKAVTPTEANKLTKGKENNGFLISDIADYGISAFLPQVNGGKNVFESSLNKGDLLVSINNNKVGAGQSPNQVAEKEYKKGFEEAKKKNADSLTKKITVVYYRNGNKGEANFQYDVNKIGEVNGAIFNLFDTQKPYDQAAGCNANSTLKNSDRCLPIMATMPVLSAGGSVAPVSGFDLNGKPQIQFPENIRKTEKDDGTLSNSTKSKDIEAHVSLFPFPEKNLDESYINACFQGYPQSWYTQLIENFAGFIGFRGDKTDFGDENFNPKKELWLEMREKTADDIVLFEDSSGKITLKSFTNRYGLFDGIDNDNDGLVDYKWIDKDEDGELDTQFFDYDEEKSNPLPVGDLQLIARKMFAKEAEYMIPAALNATGRDLYLKVNPKAYKNGGMSSMIVHNEPTDHTILQAAKSMATPSLPIDNPRYVAFMTMPGAAPKYAVKDGKSAFSYSGKLQKVFYPNLFEIENSFQLSAQLNVLADQIAVLPGSYRVFGENAKEGQYDLAQIKEEILKKYLLPVVKGELDKSNGFDLEAAAAPKIADALFWKGLNIDKKHEYVFSHYLNGTENAFANDNALIPAPNGYEPRFGYESAYLVLNGKSAESFEMNFHKDIPDEDNPAFKPLGKPEDLPEYAENQPITEEEVSGDDTDITDFVMIWDFLKEIADFIEYFTKEPQINGACSAGTDILELILSDNEKSEKIEISKLELKADRTEVEFSPKEKIKITVVAYDKSGNPVGNHNDPVVLNISQNGDYFAINGGDTLVISGGKAVFEVIPTREAGSAVVSARVGEVNSNAITINSTLSSIGVTGEDFLTANGEDIGVYKISLFDGNGKLDTKARGIKFTLTDVNGNPTKLASIEGADSVISVNGIAEVRIKAGKKAGSVTLRSEVNDSGYPVSETDIALLSGEVSSILIEPESVILPEHMTVNTGIKISLRDEFNNIAADQFGNVLIFSEGLMIDATDLEPERPGITVPVVNGVVDIQARTGEKNENSKIFAILDSEELREEMESGDADFTKYPGASKQFVIADQKDFKLEINFGEKNGEVNGKIIPVGVKLFYKDKVLSGYNGKVKVSVEDNTYGGFPGEIELNMHQGVLNEANSSFIPSSKAGIARVRAEAPGFASAFKELKILPGKAVSLKISSDRDAVSSGEKTVLAASLMDKYGNLVETDKTTVVKFTVTDATKNIVKFGSSSNAVALNGVAKITVEGGDNSGEAHIYAIADGVKPDTLMLKVRKEINADKFAKFSPRALYVSLLGGDFGDAGSEKNLAEAILFSNGVVESVSAVTADSGGGKKLFSINDKGGFEAFNEAIEAEVLPANQEFAYQKLIVKEGNKNQQLAEVVYVPKAGMEVSLIDQIPENEGIFVRRISSTDQQIVFNEKEQGVEILKGNQVLFYLDKFGRILKIDEKLTLRLSAEDDPQSEYFNLILEDRGEVLAHIIFKAEFKNKDGSWKNVHIVEKFGSFEPGVYVAGKGDPTKYKAEKTLLGNSTADGLGVVMTDLEQEMDNSQLPGFPFGSVEDAKEKFGIGFEGDNKHMLLFSAGSSVGEAQMMYASDVSIIYGDPMIRLKKDDHEGIISKLTWYTKDIGVPIFNGNKEIKQLLEFDYDSDGADDLLLVYESGLVRLLQNKISNSRFVDRGFVLDVSGGIDAAARIDVNNDAFDDLIVGTKEPCVIGEFCAAVFVNEQGKFVRKSLKVDLEPEVKILEIKTADLNNDGCEDAVFSDNSANLRFLYNSVVNGKCSGLELHPDSTKNYGFSIDSDKNSIETVFAYYSGAPEPKTYVDEQNNFYTFKISTSNPGKEENLSVEGDFDKQKYLDSAKALAESVENSVADKKVIPKQTYVQEFEFVKLKSTQSFASSKRTITDLNGKNVSFGDKIKFEIKLKNNGNLALNNILVSDLMPVNMTLNEESLTCESCNDDLSWIETGISMRPYIINGLSLSKGEEKTVSYVMTVREIPEVSFEIGHNFTDFPEKDEFTDILVRPSVNPDGSVYYLYSDGLSKGKVVYKEFKENPSSKKEKEKLYDQAAKGAGGPPVSDLLKFSKDLMNSTNNPSDLPEIPDSVENFANNAIGAGSADENADGCLDSWSGFMKGISGLENDITGAIEEFNDAVNGIGNAVKSMTALIRCSGGGCLPIPWNFAFLAQNGPTPTDPTFIPGVPVLSFASYFPFILPMVPTLMPSDFRIYASPTLTGGLGTAFCVGPSSGFNSPCFAYAVPMQALGACPNILGPVTDAISTAKNAVFDNEFIQAEAGMAAIVSDGQDRAAEAQIANNDPFTGSDTISGGGSFNDPDLGFAASGKVNVKIPGFPSFITNWFDAQIEEIYNKLLDLPDFYFIYPDVNTLIDDEAIRKANFSDIGSLSDFLDALNSVPLINIETKEVEVKIPSISRTEIEKYKIQADAWVKHHEEEIEKIKEFWSCDINEDRKTLCDKVTLNLTELIASVQEFIKILDEISLIPYKLLSFRTAESQLATQIVCYLDAIMLLTGGYIKKQQKTVEAWIKASEDIVNTFKNWKVLLDLMIDYQVACDQCQNHRFSKLGLLFSLMAVIPEPPIIPMPKLPDIVFDMSQIKAGATIVWPDLVFRPVPIKLPDLPTVTIPEVIPDVVINVPGFEVPDFLKAFQGFTLPAIPSLPPLPIPELPDLPRPPMIPTIPQIVVDLVLNLKPILQLLCLLMKGFIPVPEAFLATEIETLTQPSVQVVLPLLAALSIQTPAIEYDYVEQIKINAKTEITINSDFLYLLAKFSATFSNKIVDEGVKWINRVTRFPLQDFIDMMIKKAEEEAKKGIQKGIDEASGETDGIIQSYAPIDGEVSQLNLLSKEFETFSENMSKYVKELQKEQENIPQEYHLVAGVKEILHDDPLLNRSLAQLEQNLSIQDLPQTSGIKNLADYRARMLAYAKDASRNSRSLQELSGNEYFDRVLVKDDVSVPRIASISVVKDAVDTASKGSLYGEEQKNRLLAAASDLLPDEFASQMESGSKVPTPKGVFVVAEGKNENVLTYVSELSKTTNLVFSDVDDDKDTDIVYSMGSNVYLKYNYKNQKKLPKGEIISPQKNLEIQKYLKKVAPVEKLTVTGENFKSADLKWEKPQSDVVAYEINLMRDLLSEDLVYQYLVIYENTPENIKKELRDKYGKETILSAISDNSNPNLKIEINNGFYYGAVRALNENGEASLVSPFNIVAPSICADKEPPFPVAPLNAETELYKPFVLDTGNSFDSTGEITAYYLEVLPRTVESGLEATKLPKKIWSDLDVTKDENGDGFVSNDMTNPIFKLGPFEKTGDNGEHKFVLHIIDQSGNSSAQDFTLNVRAPEIEVEQSADGSFSGKIGQEKGEVPFKIMNQRYIYRVVDDALAIIPGIKEIKTKSYGKDGYTTDENGNFAVNDFNTDSIMYVENSEGDPVLEINMDNGNMKVLKEGYKVRVNPAVPPSVPTSISILDSKGKELGKIYLIADGNIDVKINKADFGSNFGVQVRDMILEDQFYFESVKGNSPSYPGAAVMRNSSTQKNVMIADTSGNIVILDSGITLRLKENDYLKEKPIIEAINGNKVIAEIFIGTGIEKLKIVGPNDVPFALPDGVLASLLFAEKNSSLAFTGYDSEALGYMEDLLKKGVFDREADGAGILLNPQHIVTRSEFVKTLLIMLCIVPREEASKAFEDGTGYSDIFLKSTEFKGFYAYVKEATLLGLVEGYAGEKNQSGLNPFKPFVSISRAEGVKIILEALNLKKKIDLSGVQESEPWYLPYMELGRKIGLVKQDEFLNPGEPITTQDLVVMAGRVLDLYDCYEVDENKDGVKDYCQAKYNIENPEGDIDEDSLSNKLECELGLNPTAKDSDKGGTTDDVELILGSNPLNPLDDPHDSDGDGLTNLLEISVYKTDPLKADTDQGGVNDGVEVSRGTNPLDSTDDGLNPGVKDAVPGIYGVPANCNSCPCVSTFNPKPDIMPGDTIFMVVPTENFSKPHIESKSKEIIIQSEK